MSLSRSQTGLSVIAFFAGLLVFSTTARAEVTFTDIGAGLQGTYYDTADWCDFDSDGDLDLLLSGCTGGITDAFTRIYRNSPGAGGFVATDVGLPPLMFGDAAWGDYDGDGDPDLALMGGDTSSTPVTRIFRNNSPFLFSDIGAGLAQLYDGTVAWGDFDNDGDLDLLLTGAAPGPVVATKLYRNNGAGTFMEIATTLPAIRSGATAWGDYDNDGDLDVLLAGMSAAGAYLAGVYRNDGGAVFTDVAAGLAGVSSCAAAWGDYDHDGDLDILLAGTGAGNVPVTRVYRNDGAGLFTSAGAGLPDVRIAAAAWGDYDNDGDLDILLSGLSADSTPIARIYRNDGGGMFSDGGAGIDDIAEGSAAWGDYDNDGDLDLALTGRASYLLHARIYRSGGGPANTPPSAPSLLDAEAFANRVTLSWHGSVDVQTPAASLTYNLRIGTSPGGSQISSAMANSANGYRRVVAQGNAQQRHSWEVTFPSGTFYWSVQAIDGAFAGSPFATEQVVAVSAVDETGLPPGGLLRLEAVGLPGTRQSIRFHLPDPGPASLRMFDVAGRCVRVLVEENLPTGDHQVPWDGANDAGRRVAAGAYLCRLEAGGLHATCRVVRLE